jgi:hypothetical protein
MAPLNGQERRDFLEICDDRYNRRSTILTSQLPVDKWHPQIGDRMVADSILDRLVHNTYRIEQSGDSIRKKKGRGSSRIGLEVAHERFQADSQTTHRLVCGGAGGCAGLGITARWGFQAVYPSLLQADRHTVRTVIELTDFARVLRKAPVLIEADLDELHRAGV